MIVRRNASYQLVRTLMLVVVTRCRKLWRASTMRCSPIHFVALAGALLLIASSPAWTQSFRTYVNARFGTTAEVPAAWKPDPPPANGDGRVFRSPDGRASISVYGSLQASESIEEEMRTYEEPQSGEKITYHWRGPHAVVVSGTRGHTIFYAKHVLGCADRVWNHVLIEYPAREKAAYDLLVTRVAGSLRSGRGAQLGACG
jgi:hypothetical protein